MSKQKATGLRIERVPIGSISEDPANLRLHPERNVDAIAASLRRFGQQVPIVVDSNGVVRAGNGRLMAARKLGWSEIDIVHTSLKDSELIAYSIADNRTAELAEWDNKALASMLEELRANDLLDGVGFEPMEIDDLLKREGLFDEPSMLDSEPESPPEEPVSRMGDLWLLGEHRLLCGDSTSPEQVERLLDGNRPELTITDPPYGVDYDPEWRADAAEQGHLAYASRRLGRVANDDRVDWSAAWQLSPSNVFYVWHAGVACVEVLLSLTACDIIPRSQIIWSKPHLPISRGHYHWRHEPCWYAVRKGKTAGWIGDRKQSTIWEIALDRNVGGSDGGHSTQNPVECMARPMRNHTGDVYEPFSGSGTTIIAAENIKRRCYAMELEPGYVDVAAKRWSKVSGREAMLVANGFSAEPVPFTEVERIRKKSES